jgi:hypothetical protein
VIHNATILRIDTPAASTPSGTTAHDEGIPVAIRCNVEGPSESQQWQIDRLKLDATAVLYARLGDMPEGATIEDGHRLLVLVDGQAEPTLYEVRKVTRRVKRELSHVQCFLRAR